MKKIETLDELHQIERESLIFFDQVCRKHNIRYFIMYGTLIGAARHKGFIPWDDDVDIALPRKDYERLVAIMSTEYRDSPYGIASAEGHPDYFYGLSKFYNKNTLLIENQLGKPMEWMGVYMDLFPMDGYTGTRAEATKKMQQYRRDIARVTNCRIFWSCNTFKLKCIRLFQFIKYGILGRDRSYRKVIEKIKLNDFDHSPWVGITNGSEGEGVMLNPEYFADSIDLDFEGLKLKAPIGWHECLTSIYGDYMQLPPEEQRHSHPFDAYIRD